MISSTIKLARKFFEFMASRSEDGAPLLNGFFTVFELKSFRVYFIF